MHDTRNVKTGLTEKAIDLFLLLTSDIFREVRDDTDMGTKLGKHSMHISNRVFNLYRRRADGNWVDLRGAVLGQRSGLSHTSEDLSGLRARLFWGWADLRSTDESGFHGAIDKCLSATGRNKSRGWCGSWIGVRQGDDTEGVATLRAFAGASRINHAFQTGTAHAGFALGACVRDMFEIVKAYHTLARHGFATERASVTGSRHIAVALLAQLASALATLERGLTFRIANGALVLGLLLSLFLLSQLSLAHRTDHGLTMTVRADEDSTARALKSIFELIKASGTFMLVHQINDNCPLGRGRGDRLRR